MDNEELLQTTRKLADSEEEPKSIICLGNRLNAKKIADLGQDHHLTSDGLYYKRIRLYPPHNIHICAGCFFDVLCFDHVV